MFGLSFSAPIVLLGLLALPALYFLLRATPPPPRTVAFPAIRLLRGLAPQERTPARMPWWLLMLRMLAASLLVLGFAGPEFVQKPLIGGTAPILLAIDNGFAAAADFPARLRAARRVVRQNDDRGIVLLATAPDASGKPIEATGVLTEPAALAALGVLRPEPWPDDFAEAARAVRQARHRTHDLSAIYLTDAIAAPDRRAFLGALDPALIVTPGPDGIGLLLPPKLSASGQLIARLRVAPQVHPVTAHILSEDQSGAVLARTTITVPAGESTAGAKIDLPPPILDRVSRLVLDGNSGAAGVVRLDAASRRLSVGLAAGGGAGADQKFLGSLYYVRRAIRPDDRIVTAPIDTLLHDHLSALVLADLPLSAEQIARLHQFAAQGGAIIRFAGPLTAAKPDALSPDPLLPGSRSLGGALDSAQPGKIADFPPNTPLSGLAPPGGTKIQRQILADPSHLDPATIWARLEDGTPIILGERIGRGALVDVLTTANADWSNWPLAADFPTLLDRLLRLGTGTPPRQGTVTPLQALNGIGDLVRPGPAARPIQLADLPGLIVSPAHPPGIWGNTAGSLTIALGDHVPKLRAAAEQAGVPVAGFDMLTGGAKFGPDLLAACQLLLLLDLILSFGLRGLLHMAAMLLLISAALAPARADSLPQGVPRPAIETRLAYVATGDPARDADLKAGLASLSLLVDSETSANLGPPEAVVPGVDHLDFYPLLYWQITPATPVPTPKACAALDGFMASGGLLVIDTDGSDVDSTGSGAGFDPGAARALRRVVACLAMPPLVQLDEQATLAHTFFILRDFSGRFTGAPVYIAQKDARDADGMSPVVIGANDWAGAWARDDRGAPLHALLPGDPGQRAEAERFGVNLVMYALTGTYKSDQLQIDSLLRRLRQ